jgi:hypothetical protein
MRGLFRILAILSIPIGIAAFYSFYSEEPGLERRARDLACQGQPSPCRLRLSRVARMPWKRAFVFASGGSAKVQVSCTRTAVLVGDHACARAASVEY